MEVTEEQIEGTNTRQRYQYGSGSVSE